jgi:uncharacterized protein (DUF1330 family)
LAAYLIYICHEFRDKKGHLEYAAAFPETVKDVNYRVLAAYTAFEILEGHEPVKGAVLIEFPSYDAAKKWYDSAEYAKVRGHRIRNSYTGILIDGGSRPLAERFPDVS